MVDKIPNKKDLEEMEQLMEQRNWKRMGEAKEKEYNKGIMFANRKTTDVLMPFIIRSIQYHKNEISRLNKLQKMLFKIEKISENGDYQYLPISSFIVDSEDKKIIKQYWQDRMKKWDNEKV